MSCRSSPSEVFLREKILTICFATLLKSHFAMSVILLICCIFSVHRFIKIHLKGCFWSWWNFEDDPLSLCSKKLFCVFFVSFNSHREVKLSYFLAVSLVDVITFLLQRIKFSFVWLEKFLVPLNINFLNNFPIDNVVSVTSYYMNCDQGEPKLYNWKQNYLYFLSVCVALSAKRKTGTYLQK